MFDACHLLKLVRNLFEQVDNLVNYEGKRFEWKFVVRLYQLQQQEGMRAANKLTKQHVFFHNQRMKVKLAAQLFSESVANAMEFATDIDPVSFHECQATIEFVLIMNQLFDTLNSRNALHKGNKKPLYKESLANLNEFYFNCAKYLRSLCLPDGRPVTQSNKKIGILGMLIDMRQDRTSSKVSFDL